MKRLHKIFIALMVVVITIVIFFAIISIVYMNGGRQKEVDAFGNMLKIDGSKPEQIDAQQNMLKISLTNQNSRTIIQLVSIIILGITAYILLWYSSETKRLADLTAKQIDINIRPIIAIRLSGNIFHIKNIGRSPAFNIFVHDIVNGPACVKSDIIDICEVDVEKEINSRLFGDGYEIVTSKEKDFNYSRYLYKSSQEQGKGYDVIIDYDDIERNTWRTKYTLTKRGMELEKITKIPFKEKKKLVKI